MINGNCLKRMGAKLGLALKKILAGHERGIIEHNTVVQKGGDCCRLRGSIGGGKGVTMGSAVASETSPAAHATYLLAVIR